MNPSRRQILGNAISAAGLLVLPRELWSVPRLQPDRPELDVAQRAERWIRRARAATEHGVSWPADPLIPSSVQRSFYNGFPGIVLFLLELYHSTGDRQYLDEAALGAAELMAGLPPEAAAVRDAG